MKKIFRNPVLNRRTSFTLCLIFLFVLPAKSNNLANRNALCKQAKQRFINCEQRFKSEGAKNVEPFCKDSINAAKHYCGYTQKADGTIVIGGRKSPSFLRNRLSRASGPVRQLGPKASACSRMPHCSGSSHIEIDIESKCMCVGKTCFAVGVGKNKSWNPRGTGIVQAIDRPDGAGRYQTNHKTRSDRYDDDAVAMSLPGVWDTGKWLHKSGNCSSHWTTQGCVAVPCSMWDLVKGSIGKSITICRSGGGLAPDPKRPSKRKETDI